MSLKPWREVAVPHQDVLEGTFQESEFAADLTKVVRGIAPPEYQDPVLFFERTVITEGMALLLDGVIRRLSGSGGDPVIQLQTAFGGGKTHTLLAVYHIAHTDRPAKELRGVASLLDQVGVTELPRGQVAVLDGNYLSPAQPQSRGKVTTRTLWGELAFQLGGADGYAMVRDSDEAGVSPGKRVLTELLERFGPAVILMDETVAYLRQFDSGKSYPGGTYDANLSFVQALTEAVAGVSNAVLLASLPESAVEVGDVHGARSLASLEKYFGRIEALWKPVATDEAFEIVRRRLFQPIRDDATRTEVARAFGETYRLHAEAFPSDVLKGEYEDKIERAYPIHPEVFDRLYEDWSTLDGFQRTRGVLRLVARMVHTLWREDNRDYLIMPGSVPLDDPRVRNELIKYLPAGWDPVIERDVDGPASQPRRVDDEVPSIGSLQASRRVARTIFLGSAPGVSGQKVRGVGQERVRLGAVQPGQSPGKYDDALKRLSDRLHYLYSGSNRYWFDLRTNLRREMEDRLQRFDLKEHIMPELQRRLERDLAGGTFAGTHVFRAHGDIPDDQGLRLVVLTPEFPHARKEQGSEAAGAALEILKSRGSQPRRFQNRLVFLAPDREALRTVRDQARRYLAWTSIVSDTELLNLDPHHAKEAKANAKEADDRLHGSLRETFRWLLVPHQAGTGPGEPGKLEWEEIALEPGGRSVPEELERKLKDSEAVIFKWAPFHLKRMLEQWFWQEARPTARAQDVWEAMCCYPYLPRLSNRDVYEHALSEGVRDRDFFGYAAEEGSAGFTGLIFGEDRPAYVTETAVVIHPDAARAAVRERDKPVPPDKKDDDREDPDQRRIEPIIDPPPKPVVRRFHATVVLDPVKAVLDFQSLVKEVVEHFSTDAHAQVSITVDLRAEKREGFDTDVQRTVSENCGSLKVKDWGFEKD